MGMSALFLRGVTDPGTLAAALPAPPAPGLPQSRWRTCPSRDLAGSFQWLASFRSCSRCAPWSSAGLASGTPLRAVGSLRPLSWHGSVRQCLELRILA
jgi:hypothetical protein